VTIVKDAWASPKGDYSALGHVLRQGRNGKPGLTFMVCVDGSKVSKQAFDFAAGCLRRDDILYAFYVTDTSKGGEDARVTAEFSTECGKLQHTVNGLGAAELRTGRYQPGDSTAPAGGGGTVLWPIRSAILGFAEEAEVDVLVMGSAELAHADKKHTLGSICAAVAKETRCHFCVVKNTSISA